MLHSHLNLWLKQFAQHNFMHPISFEHHFNHNGRVSLRKSKSDCWCWQSIDVTTRLYSKYIVETTQFYGSNYRSWSNTRHITFHERCARQFSSPVLQLFPRVASILTTTKIQDLLRGIATLVHCHYLFKFSEFLLKFSRFLFSVGSARSKFHFSLNALPQYRTITENLAHSNSSNTSPKLKPTMVNFSFSMFYPIPAFADQFKSSEHKFNNHFLVALRNNFLLITCIHCPEQHLPPMGKNPATITLIIREPSKHTKQQQPLPKGLI